MTVAMKGTVQNTGAICRIEESPFRILKIASSGNLKEFKRLYEQDHGRLYITDSKGQTVVHHAASKGRQAILEFILEKGGDINAKDKKGNTALHVVVQKNQSQCVDFLLDNGARPDILNTDNMAAIHLAVELNKPKVLEALLARPEVDPNLPGDLGSTPLHYAAVKDSHECAKLLLRFAAGLSCVCEVGYSPAYLAAKHGSVNSLEVFLSQGATLGCDPLDILKMTDKENNTVLHAAVMSGELKVVQLCLKYGADINNQQADGETPVHLACSQGNYEMVKVLFDASNADPATVMAVDGQGMTYLHTAALFDHAHLADYLIQKGCDINACDKEGRTPLILAAAKHGWQTVALLLSKGANTTMTDHRNRNFLHLAILNGAKLQEFGSDFLKDLTSLFNEKDDLGCTPLHYASQEGHLAAIDGLIKLGAFLNIKNNQKQSPLHFAAKYGRLNTCRRLLEGPQGHHIINDTDGEGLTALHIACHSGHTKVVQCLLQRGAVLHRDHLGNTPLHLAAENGYTQTMKLLLGVHAHIRDAGNKEGDTALHVAATSGQSGSVSLLLSLGAVMRSNNRDLYFFDYAIQNRHKDVAMAVVTHDRWTEALDLTSSLYGCPMIGLIQHLPSVCMAVLDRCQVSSPHDTRSKYFHYIYDFRYLQCLDHVTSKQKTRQEVSPMLPLNTMVKFNRVECLAHPVCVTYLKVKWRAYGAWLHMINIVIYMIFLACLTTYVTTFNPLHHTDSSMTLNETSYTYHTVDDVTNYFTMTLYHKVALWVMAVFCILNILKEIVQMLQQRLKYLKDLNNLLEWILYITSSIFIVPALFGLSTHVQWQCGAVAVFLAWFNFLLYLQRFDFFGIYVVMFLEILKTLIQVILIFSILIIAFGLSFYILLSGEESRAHSTPGLSLMRTFIMMLGEIDYIPTWVDQYADNKEQTLHFKHLTLFFLVVFVLLMPILLMNLLIGLAVGDIEQVQKNARLKRLAMQVELHSDLERKLPIRFLKCVNKMEHKEYPNAGAWFFTRLLHCMQEEEHSAVSEDGKGQGSFRVTMPSQTSLVEEIYKQKRRLRDMSENLEKQYELLRLVVQKMEIKSEADEKDVGGATVDLMSSGTRGQVVGGQLMQQVSVVTHWRRLTKKYK